MAVGTGERAPEFDLEEAYDKPRLRLADFHGKRNVLLVFHPFAFTAVCREEALDLQANLEQELGVSYAFASDFWQHGAAARAYGVFDERTGAPVRGTFLIDKDGIVIWSLVKDGKRTEMVPESLRALEA